MANWTNPNTYSVGSILSVNDWNAIANNETFLYQKPYGMYYASTAASVTASTDYNIPLNSTLASNYGMSLSSASVTLPLSGVYSVSFSVGIQAASGAGGFLKTWVGQNGNIALNGTRVVLQTIATCAGGSGLIYANANDVIGLSVNQSALQNYQFQTNPSLTYLHVVFQGSQ